jgi:hypothetical protein
LAVVLDAGLRRLLLGGGFEAELVDFAHGQALGQIVEGAMLMARLVAVAVGFATAGEALDEGGAQTVRQDLELRKQKVFALAQGQGGLASGGVYLCHIYGEDTQTSEGASEVVRWVMPQTDGKVLVVGGFSRFNGQDCVCVARVLGIARQ